jgi:hypothetical protein
MADAASGELGRDNREAIRAFVWLGIFFFAVTAAAYVFTVSSGQGIPRDGTTLVVGRDFLNFWMYGRAAVTPDPGHIYDAAAYNQELAALLGPGYPGQNWSYPPSIMLLAAPFGQFGYLSALLAWTVLSVGIFASVARRNLSGRLLLALMLSPAALLCIASGQNSLMTAALLIAIFAWLDSRPVAAGILIGLLTLKPQVGLLLPVMLIASGRWRVFWSAAAVSLAIAGLTAALASAVQVGRLTGASPQADPTLLLTVVAAVLIGGTAYTGGDGGVLGTVFGVLFLGVVQNGLTLSDVSSFWHGTVSGAILIAAVGLGLGRHRGWSLLRR